MLRYIPKIIKLFHHTVSAGLSWLITVIKLKLNGATFYTDFSAHGVPIVNVNLKGTLIIGRKLSIHSGTYFNMIGRQQPCFLIVGKGAKLTIGSNVGISSAAIVCWSNITIEDNVKIGGGVVIYDTDFHSLDERERNAEPEVTINIKTRDVLIKANAFIGAHSIILKGVTIGASSIIGAGSVVSKSVPDGEIWAGNPAMFIRKIEKQ